MRPKTRQSSKNNRKHTEKPQRTKKRQIRQQTDGKTNESVQLILLNKPFGVLSQFSDQKNNSTNPEQSSRATLADYIDIPDVYPAGRLDRDSEGLLLLTNDGHLQARISQPAYKLEKTYLAQVEGLISHEALKQLQTGIELKDGPAKALVARVSSQPPWLWPRNPPIRFRKNVADSWLELVINEGRNRQVRRMTAAVGHPTLRLLRIKVGDWQLGDLTPGQWRFAKPD